MALTWVKLAIGGVCTPHIQVIRPHYTWVGPGGAGVRRNEKEKPSNVSLAFWVDTSCLVVDSGLLR